MIQIEVNSHSFYHSMAIILKLFLAPIGLLFYWIRDQIMGGSNSTPTPQIQTNSHPRVSCCHGWQRCYCFIYHSLGLPHYLLRLQTCSPQMQVLHDAALPTGATTIALTPPAEIDSTSTANPGARNHSTHAPQLPSDSSGQPLKGRCAMQTWLCDGIPQRM